MAPKPTAYPPLHSEALEGVMKVIDLVAAHPDLGDDGLVLALRKGGVGEVDAELLVRFVPCALAFALLKLMGLNRFPSTFQVKNEAGEWVEMPLAAEHYFSAALGVGHDVTTRGYTERISKATFQDLTMRSAEMNAVNQFLGAGHTLVELARGSLAPPALIGITAEQITESRTV